MGKLKAAKTIAKAAAPVAAESMKAIRSDKREREQHTADLLEQINQKLEKRISFVETFKRGIVRGVGTAIGATIIAAIGLGILSRVVNTVDDVPIIRDIIEEANIDDSLSQ